MKYLNLAFDECSEVYPPKPASVFFADHAIQIAKPGQKILDACTGSGIVGIAIAKYVPNVSVMLSDRSLEALKNAQDNAKQNNVMVSTLQSDMYDGLNDQKFDLITVHPPAVPYPKGQDWGMTKGMRVATDGGNDGSQLVERSITEAKRHLRSKGSLLLLLPHWSNIKKAMKILRSHYEEIKILESKAVDFFPMIEGRPTRALIEHIKQLAAEGIIEMEFPENAPPQSSVTIIKANKMIL